MEFLKLATVNNDPIDAIDALSQVKNVNLAVDLIKAGVGKKIDFLIPVSIEEGYVCWVMLLEKENNFKFIRTKFETIRAGQTISITLDFVDNSSFSYKIHKAAKELALKANEEDFKLSYATLAKSFQIDNKIYNPLELLKKGLLI